MHDVLRRSSLFVVTDPIWCPAFPKWNQPKQPVAVHPSNLVIHITSAMSSHSYEVALSGEFFSRDLKAILNRITLHSESSAPMHTREIVFEPIDAQLQRDAGADPIILRAKKELTEPDSGWYVILESFEVAGRSPLN
jgi:hypothetical protein